MAKIGIMRCNTKYDYSFVAEKTGKDGLQNVSIYLDSHCDASDYDLVKVVLPQAKISEDKRKLTTLDKLIFSGEDEFSIFDISNQAYGFIMNPDCLNDPNYIEKVFVPMRKFLGETEKRAREKIKLFNEPYKGLLSEELLKIKKEYSKIMTISYLLDSNLWAKEINGWDSKLKRHKEHNAGFCNAKMAKELCASLKIPF